MYNVTINPKRLQGKISIPPSKSVAHRLLICSALANGKSQVQNLSMSDDIIATIKSLESLGAKITLNGNTATVIGISKTTKSALIDCNESGSTLRFMIPVVAALGVNATFTGRGKLPQRPIDTYINEFSKKGIEFDYNNTMPFSLSGNLKSGVFSVEGNISSQFITGLLFALPLLDGDSEIKLLSKLESKPYVDITIDCLKKFGVIIKETSGGFYIKGNQKYNSCNTQVEADFSQAAFFLTANALGNNIEIDNLNYQSHQGDKKIIEIIEEISYNNKDGFLKPFKIDGSDIPDIVPIMSVLACFCKGTSEIFNVSRLKIKESNRLNSIAVNLNKIGGKVTQYDDKLVIEGTKEFTGGEVDSFNDHRIVMSMAIAATICKEKLTILGAESVKKSYPEFFKDYIKLGGNINVICLE